MHFQMCQAPRRIARPQHTHNELTIAEGFGGANLGVGTDYPPEVPGRISTTTKPHHNLACTWANLRLRQSKSCDRYSPAMSEFGNIIKHLRGAQSQQQLAHATGLSSRTIQRAENGRDVRLGTLRTLSKYFKLDKAEHASLILAWLRLELRGDFPLFDIRIHDTRNKGKGRAPTDTEQFLETFRSVPARYQKELMLAAEREEVLRTLPAINELWDRLKNHPLRR